jgi:potassium channel
MQAEYFAPKEDIILQNDNPSELYLLVSGAVVRNKNSAILRSQ